MAFCFFTLSINIDNKNPKNKPNINPIKIIIKMGLYSGCFGLTAGSIILKIYSSEAFIKAIFEISNSIKL